ncbi:unnamed protein product [Penicillium pancosmium]
MPLASKHTLNLDAADPSDAEAIGNLFFAGFHDHPYFRKMMPDTSQARKCWTDHIIYCLQDPYTIVLKVTDSDVNKIVSMGLWLKPKKEEDRHQPGYEEGRIKYTNDFMACCDEETATALFGAFEKNREDFMNDRPHYSEAYKGQGAGSLILQHGCELADKDKLECYIDSSPRGKRVYEKFGFVFTKHVPLPMHYKYHFGVRRPQTDADESSSQA